MAQKKNLVANYVRSHTPSY